MVSNSLAQSKAAPIFREPTFAGRVVGHGALDALPEGMVVAVFMQVNQFVYDDVVNDGRWQEHGAPVKIEDICMAA